VISLGVERPGGDVAHSHLSSAEVKNPWICSLLPPCAFTL